MFLHIQAMGVVSSKDRELIKKKVKELRAATEKEKKQQEKERKAREKEQKKQLKKKWMCAANIWFA